MKKFALLNENNLVLNISIADNSWDSTGWVEYNNSNPASIGGDYVDGYFYSVRPFASWTRNAGNWLPLIGFYLLVRLILLVLNRIHLTCVAN
jgi:hypothetical protein